MRLRSRRQFFGIPCAIVIIPKLAIIVSAIVVDIPIIPMGPYAVGNIGTESLKVPKIMCPPLIALWKDTLVTEVLLEFYPLIVSKGKVTVYVRLTNIVLVCLVGDPVVSMFNTDCPVTLPHSTTFFREYIQAKKRVLTEQHILTTE